MERSWCLRLNADILQASLHTSATGGNHNKVSNATEGPDKKYASSSSPKHVSTSSNFEGEMVVATEAN
jgi:hypothetical protein